MFRPPLRDRLVLADKKALLIDRLQATREARAAVLRSRGVEVNEAEEISAARFLWQPDVYDLVMLDLRKYSMEETREFYEQIKGASPPQQFAFLTGPLGTCRVIGQMNSPRVTLRADSGHRRSSASWPLLDVFLRT